MFDGLAATAARMRSAILSRRRPVAGSSTPGLRHRSAPPGPSPAQLHLQGLGHGDQALSPMGVPVVVAGKSLKQSISQIAGPDFAARAGRGAFR